MHPDAPCPPYAASNINLTSFNMAEWLFLRDDHCPLAAVPRTGPGFSQLSSDHSFVFSPVPTRCRNVRVVQGVAAFRGREQRLLLLAERDHAGLQPGQLLPRRVRGHSAAQARPEHAGCPGVPAHTDTYTYVFTHVYMHTHASAWTAAGPQRAKPSTRTSSAGLAPDRESSSRS